LNPGEWFYSVVQAGDDSEEASLVRRDIAAQAWQGPPDDALGWWKNRMPQAGTRKMKLAPDAVLVDLMRRLLAAEDAGVDHLAIDAETIAVPSIALANHDDQCDSAAGNRGPLMYLFALMLMRRRLIQAADEPREHESTERAAGSNDPTQIWFEFADDGTRFSVTKCPISGEQAKMLGDSLVELLYCEAD
jgi:hypothetical protein